MALEKYHLLVVDDDARLRDLLAKFLGDHNFYISTSRDAAQARELLKAVKFDLIILDIMMPGENGLELTKYIRNNCFIPVLLLTAMGETKDRITGLAEGADDYLSKPFEPQELLLRIQRLLERSSKRTLEKKKVRIGEYDLDLKRNLLIGKSGEVALTDMEANLLQVLLNHGDKPVSREELATASTLEINPRSIDVQITRLRRKIEPDPKTPKYLQTIRHAGYVLRAER